jgi:hypothetical protein
MTHCSDSVNGFDAAEHPLRAGRIELEKQVDVCYNRPRGFVFLESQAAKRGIDGWVLRQIRLHPSRRCVDPDESTPTRGTRGCGRGGCDRGLLAARAARRIGRSGGAVRGARPEDLQLRAAARVPPGRVLRRRRRSRSAHAHARERPSFSFGDATQDERKFLDAAVLLENTGVAAYNGQAANLTKKALAAAAEIVSVEGRHAAWVSDLAGVEPAPHAADRGASAKAVVSTLRETAFLKGT